jgi:hypothetical protein
MKGVPLESQPGIQNGPRFLLAFLANTYDLEIHTDRAPVFDAFQNQRLIH